MLSNQNLLSANLSSQLAALGVAISSLFSCNADLQSKQLMLNSVQSNYSSAQAMHAAYRQQKEQEIKNLQSSCTVNMTDLQQQLQIASLSLAACEVTINASRTTNSSCLDLVKKASSEHATCSRSLSQAMTNLTACSAMISSKDMELIASKANASAAQTQIRQQQSILANALTQSSVLNTSLQNCGHQLQVMTAAASNYRALFTEAMANLTVLQAKLAATTPPATTPQSSVTSTENGLQVTTACTTSTTKAAAVTTDSVELSKLRNRIQELEGREHNFQKNITWHQKRYRNISGMYDHVQRKNRQLQDELNLRTTSIDCPEPWGVIANSYEGRIMIGLAGGFLLLTLILIAVLCRKRNRHTVHRATKTFQDLTEDVYFGRRKYSTTEKPILGRESMEMSDAGQY